MPPTPQPTLRDGELVLRPWEDDDIEPTRLLHDQEVARWFGLPDEPPTPEQHRAAVQRWRREWADEQQTVNFLCEFRGERAGIVELRRKDHAKGELSWVTWPGHRGQGVAHRAVRLLVDFAFRELGIGRVEAYVHAANRASVRTALKAGLRREGLLRGEALIHGERADTVVLGRRR